MAQLEEPLHLGMVPASVRVHRSHMRRPSLMAAILEDLKRMYLPDGIHGNAYTDLMFGSASGAVR